MACGCKSVKSMHYRRPFENVGRRLEPAKVLAQAGEEPAPEEVFDFSSTTKPDEVCFNCAAKHIALAAALIETGGYRQKLAACGEICLASMHFPDHPERRSFYYFTAVSLMKKFCSIRMEDLRPLLKLTVHPDDPPPFIYPDLPGPDIEQLPYSCNASWPADYMAMLSLLSAHCMLYTEITYEKINLVYAIGELTKAAIWLDKHGYPDQAREIRKVWKLLQEGETDIGLDKLWVLAYRLWADWKGRLWDCP